MSFCLFVKKCVPLQTITVKDEKVPVNGTRNHNFGTVNSLTLAAQLDIPVRTIKRELYYLRDIGLIHRVGSDKNSHWEVIK